MLAPLRVVILALAGLTPSPLGLVLGLRRSQSPPVQPLARLNAPLVQRRRAPLVEWGALAVPCRFPAMLPPRAQPLRAPRVPVQLPRKSALPPRLPVQLPRPPQPLRPLRSLDAPVGRRRLSPSQFLRALALLLRHAPLVGWDALAAPCRFPATPPPRAQPLR